MNKVQTRVRRLAAIAVVLGVLSPAVSAQKLQYPASKKVEQVDTYFGVKVADPYRWLEDDASARGRELGRGAEQGHLRLPRKDSLPRRRSRSA